MLLPREASAEQALAREFSCFMPPDLPGRLLLALHQAIPVASASPAVPAVPELVVDGGGAGPRAAAGGEGGPGRSGPCPQAADVVDATTRPMRASLAISRHASCPLRSCRFDRTWR
jgi:hypothetical protein